MMKILLLQCDIVWQSPEINRHHIEDLINNSVDTDLIILPEMFTTGFCISPKGIAEKVDSETLEWMKSIAKKRNTAIGGSIAIQDNGRYYNRFYFVKPEGTYSAYNKRHLFSYGSEDKEYTSGNDRIIVVYKGFRILLQICYDLRFPVFSRNNNDYDIIVYCANWPSVRIDAWNTLLKARAIENLCYVVGVNRIGNDPYCEYNGNSVLINHKGNVIASANENLEGAILTEIDMLSLINFRKKFRALDDADCFKLL